MLSADQLSRARQFVYRHGSLLDRKRFAFHFEGGSPNTVLDALRCYQNPDGGFGHGLELDVMCPASTPICAELALYYLDDLGVRDGDTLERLEKWIVRSQRGDGSLLNPSDEIRRYPHGPWWLGEDRVRTFSLAGLLAKAGRGSAEFFRRANRLFADHPFPPEIGKYDYPLFLYLTYAPVERGLSARMATIQDQLPAMLCRFQDHHPLLVFSYRWVSDETCRQVLEAQARLAAGDLEEDGGIRCPYPDLPWWRPVWTLEVLISLKRFGFLAV